MDKVIKILLLNWRPLSLRKNKTKCLPQAPYEIDSGRVLALNPGLLTSRFILGSMHSTESLLMPQSLLGTGVAETEPSGIGLPNLMRN